jgi:hypothetical protein
VRRAFAQPAKDVDRTVRLSRPVAALVGNRLQFAEDFGPSRDVGAAIVDRSTRIAWAAFDAHGEGLALATGGLVHVDRGGTIDRREGVVIRELGSPSRDDVARAEHRPATRIGATWLQAKGELRELWPSPRPATEPLAHDGLTIVGGATAGLVLEASGDRLHVAAIAADGTKRALGSAQVALAPGFDAVERAAGGAIVAGLARSIDGKANDAVAFAIDANGQLGARRAIALPVDRALRLVALPRGGALAFDEARTQVVWLDDDARVLASAPWPRAAALPSAESETLPPCVDGAPLPAHVPSPIPGHFAALPIEAREACLVGAFAWTDDGALTWFGSSRIESDTRAELGRIEGLADVSRATPTTSESSALAHEAWKPLEPVGQPAPCPSEMVLVSGGLCVDRWESTLLDEHRGAYLSPDHPATPNLLAAVLGDWSTRRERQGDLFARAMPLPWIAPEQRAHAPSPTARSRAGVRPSAYVTGLVARSACEAAGKRLCRLEEWKRACRGEADTLYPYGGSYEPGACNVNRPLHPAARLHESASLGHLDPRLGRVRSDDGTVLRTTGATRSCASHWGSDAIFDMVGNVDEWVDEPGGAFAGGFYARATKSGCEALVSNHPESYLDYSTGIRCCRDATATSQESDERDEPVPRP